jgi:hypothetical protein
MGTLPEDVKDMVLTDSLFVMPHPLFGVARLMDLGAELDSYNVSQTPEEADALALLCDWRMVGRDLRTAISKVETSSDLKVAPR